METPRPSGRTVTRHLDRSSKTRIETSRAVRLAAKGCAVISIDPAKQGLKHRSGQVGVHWDCKVISIDPAKQGLKRIGDEAHITTQCVIVISIDPAKQGLKLCTLYRCGWLSRWGHLDRSSKTRIETP